MLYGVAGPMFSNKTSRLIERCCKYAYEHGPESVVAILPSVDTRSGDQLRAHNGSSCTAYSASRIEDVQRIIYPRPDLRLVAVDEIQMFDPLLLRELVLVARRGVDVWAAGLMHDYRGAPYENTQALFALADHVIHTAARCVVCDQPAAWTHRKAQSSQRLLVGGASDYEPRCRRHWEEVVVDRWEPEGVPLS